MANLLRSFTDKLGGGLPHRKFDSPLPDTGGAALVDSDLSEEIESLEKLFLEQVARLKARAAARGAAHKESGKGAQRRGSDSIDLPGETASERFIAPKPRKVPESSEDSSGHGYDVDERELEIQPPAPAIQARENGDSQTNGAAPESGFLNSFASSLVQREEEMAAAMTELSQKVEQLEDRAANQRELLARQESEIRGLQAELERLRIEIGEMSTYAPAAAFSPVSEPPNAFAVSPADLEEEAEAADEQYDEDLPAELEENTSPWESNGDENPPSQTADEFLSPFLIECITTELANAMNVMEYLASLLVRRRVKAMGESIEKFPLARVEELLTVLAAEISDDARRVDFRERLAWI